jgi:hypothetical protein
MSTFLASVFFEKVEELASEDFGEGAHRDKKIAP